MLNVFAISAIAPERCGQIASKKTTPRIKVTIAQRALNAISMILLMLADVFVDPGSAGVLEAQIKEASALPWQGRVES